jgi:hypothetical protein
MEILLAVCVLNTIRGFPPSKGKENTTGVPGGSQTKHGNYRLLSRRDILGQPGEAWEQRELEVDGVTRWSTVQALLLAFQRVCQAADAFRRVGWLQQFVDHAALHRAVADGVPGAADLLAQVGCFCVGGRVVGG